MLGHVPGTFRAQRHHASQSRVLPGACTAVRYMIMMIISPDQIFWIKKKSRISNFSGSFLLIWWIAANNKMVFVLVLAFSLAGLCHANQHLEPSGYIYGEHTISKPYLSLWWSLCELTAQHRACPFPTGTSLATPLLLMILFD